MKQRNIFATIVLAFVLAIVSVFAAACSGGITLEEGKYSGTYKCSYTQNEQQQNVGCVATFEVDADGKIWNLALTAPADEGDVEYKTPSLGQRPWDTGKILGQFSGEWTPAEVMQIKVSVDAKGVPSGKDCINSPKNLTVSVGFEINMGVVILAMQNAISTANKI